MLKKVLTALVLCALLAVVGLIAWQIANQGMNIVSNADSQDASTSLLMAQAKQRVLSEKAILEDNKEVYVGEKFKECELPAIVEFKELGIIAEEEEHYDSYYVWSQQTLNELSVNVKLADGEYYIVNYETNEVITTKGIKIREKVYYRLSEIKEVVV